MQKKAVLFIIPYVQDNEHTRENGFRKKEVQNIENKAMQQFKKCCRKVFPIPPSKTHCAQWFGLQGSTLWNSRYDRMSLG